MSATQRVIHIGDLHLGPNSRQADRLAAFDLVAERTIPLPDVVLFALTGDLFDRTSTIDDRNALVPRVQRLAERAPVLVVKGNHDADGDLDFIAALKAAYPIVVVSHPDVVRLPLPTGDDAAIAVFPYPNRAGLVSAGVDSGLLEQTGSAAVETLVIALAHQLELAADAGAIPMTFWHYNIAGSRASTGQPQIGAEIEVSAAMLERFRPNVYCGFGHIHKHQEVGRGVYAGSLCRLDFGEIEPKGYIEVVQEKRGESWFHTWTFVELPVAPLYHVEGRLTRDGFTFRCTAGVDGELQPTPASWRGCEVRARVTYTKADANVLNWALVQAEFAEAKQFKLDEVPLLEATVRAPEVANAQTLEEKALAFCALSGIEITPGLRAKFADLTTRDGADVLAEVMKALSADAQLQEVA